MRNRILLPILIISITVFLTQLPGCVHLAKPPPFRYISPKVRSEQLIAIHDWIIEGALSIQSPQQSVIVHYKWVQMNQSYNINLSSALNLVRVNIIGQKNQYVRLCRSNQQCYQAKTPQELLMQQLGWHLPISSLMYWIRGVKQPGQAVQKYDVFGHLVFMRQNGFNIWFSGYKSVNGIDLPARLDLQYPNLKIRLVIKQWNI